MVKAILYYAKKFLTHELINGSILIFVGSLIVNFIIFLLNLFLVRTFSYQDYGLYAALISLISLVSIPSQALSVVIIRFATQYIVKKQHAEASSLYIKSFWSLCFLAGIIMLSFLAFSSQIAKFLFIPDTHLVLLAGLAIAVTYINIINIAFIQALLRFDYISLLTILNGVFRTIFAVIFTLLGYKVFGVITGVILAVIIPFCISFFPLQFLFVKRPKNILLPVKKIVMYGAPTAITLLALSSFTATDIILVRHFFTPHQAGLYAGLSLCGRIIFYFSAPIGGVMFPLVIKRYNEGKNIRTLFYLALMLVAVPSLLLTGMYFIFPTFIITLFLGGKDYLQLTPYLGVFALLLSLFSIVSVCVNFFLSLGKTIIAWMVIGAAAGQIIGISLFHTNFFEVISVTLGITIVLFGFLLLYYAKEYGNTAKKQK